MQWLKVCTTILASTPLLVLILIVIWTLFTKWLGGFRNAVLLCTFEAGFAVYLCVLSVHTPVHMCGGRKSILVPSYTTLSSPLRRGFSLNLELTLSSRLETSHISWSSDFWHSWEALLCYMGVGICTPVYTAEEQLIQLLVPMGMVWYIRTHLTLSFSGFQAFGVISAPHICSQHPTKSQGHRDHTLGTPENIAK